MSWQPIGGNQMQSTAAGQRFEPVCFMYSFRQRSGNLTIVLLALIALAGGGRLAASEPGRVKWSAPSHEGRAWVEHADCSQPVRDGGRLVLRTEFGFVTARTGQSNRLDCQVRLAAYTEDLKQAKAYLRSFEVNRSSREGIVYVSGKSPRGQRHRPELRAQFDIVVPPRFNLDLETQAGDVGVDRLEGQLRVSTGGGDIRTGDVAGPVKVETAIGNITLGNVGQRLEASTQGGSIRVGNVRGNAVLGTGGGEIVAGPIDGATDARSGGGDIVLRGAAGPLNAETGGGQIQIGDCGSTVRAETEGGNIRLQSARGMVRAQTGGGSIDLFRVQSSVHATSGAGTILAEINANKQTFALSRLETSVGDVEVFVPADLPLSLEAIIDEVAGQKILSDFPLLVQGGNDQDFGMGAVRGEGVLNGGGKRLVIHTLMGNIEIHKLDSPILSELRRRQEMYWSRWQALEGNLLQQNLRNVQHPRQLRIERKQRRLQEQLRKPTAREVEDRN